METAPLTLAQTHARNAALETKRANPVAASEEHDLAAAEFAAAAQLTQDSEALRILNLLEQHHKKLGQILKSRHTQTAPDISHATDSDKGSSDTALKPVTGTARPVSPDTSSQPPRLVGAGRPSARDLSSSIASNLASARGIPSNRQKRSTPVSPLVSNQYADGRFTKEDESKGNHSSGQTLQPQSGRRAAASSGRPSWAPPTDVKEKAGVPSSSEVKSDPTTSDAPFQQFYSTFESLISKLSAPLVFAGLPLSNQSSSTPQSTSVIPPTQSSKPQSPPPPTSPLPRPLDASMDYSQLISRAALRAVSRNDKSSAYGNPSESFYVVPTTGGTTSYAEIMTRADREASHHRRNTSNISSGTADDFEDASSTILPSVSHAIGRLGSHSEKKYNGKTMEELGLENKALKHLSDTLSKRLHVFEMSAQTSSAALAQSIRSLHLSPLNTPENSRGKSNTTTALSQDSAGVQLAPASGPSGVETARLKSRVTELEEILRKTDAKVRKREDENAKLKDMLGKYKEKWDSLKAGAKARRERAAGVSEPGGNGGSGGSTDTANSSATGGATMHGKAKGVSERDNVSVGSNVEKGDLKGTGAGVG